MASGMDLDNEADRFAVQCRMVRTLCQGRRQKIVSRHTIDEIHSAWSKVLAPEPDIEYTQHGDQEWAAAEITKLNATLTEADYTAADPSVKEVTAGFMMKNNKAPGPDGIVNEVWRLLLPASWTHVHAAVIGAIRHPEDINFLRVANTVLLPKKLDPGVLEQRPISLLPGAYKAISRILLATVRGYIGGNMVARDFVVAQQEEAERNQQADAIVAKLVGRLLGADDADMSSGSDGSSSSEDDDHNNTSSEDSSKSSIDGENDVSGSNDGSSSRSCSSDRRRRSNGQRHLPSPQRCAPPRQRRRQRRHPPGRGHVLVAVLERFRRQRAGTTPRRKE